MSFDSFGCGYMMKSQEARDAMKAAAKLASKPVVDIKDASTLTWGRHTVLVGVPVNHPRQSLNGKEITTSAIVNIEGDAVETRNTKYNVLSWHKYVD